MSWTGQRHDRRGNDTRHLSRHQRTRHSGSTASVHGTRDMAPFARGCFPWFPSGWRRFRRGRNGAQRQHTVMRTRGAGSLEGIMDQAARHGSRPRRGPSRRRSECHNDRGGRTPCRQATAPDRWNSGYLSASCIRRTYPSSVRVAATTPPFRSLLRRTMTGITMSARIQKPSESAIETRGPAV